MKKGIILLTIAMMLVGCASDPVATTDNTEKVEVIESINQSEEVGKEVEVPELTDNDRAILEDALSMNIVGTGQEDAEYNFEYILAYSENDIDLCIKVIKPMNEMMEYYNTDVDGIVKQLRTSLVFDNVFGLVKDNLSHKVAGLKVVFEDVPGDMYTMKYIKSE